MAIARYKDLCIDSGRGEKLGRFWAAALGLQFESDGEAGALKGATPEQRIWMNVVPELKTAKHRVHIDVHCASVADLVQLGATVVRPKAEGRRWTVLADPEGGEFCAFVREPGDLATYRFYELVIDSKDPKAMASWWAEVLGAKLDGNEEKGWWWLEDVPGLPYGSWDFVPVPEPKTVKNRIHWDVSVDSLDDLAAAGARMIRPPTDTERWFVMEDLEGNEFCAFVSGS